MEEVPQVIGRLHPLLQHVSEHYGLPITTLLGRGRSQTEVEARSVAIDLAKRRLGLNHSDLARAFNRDRSSVRNSLAIVEKSKPLQRLVLSINHRLGRP